MIERFHYRGGSVDFFLQVDIDSSGTATLRVSALVGKDKIGVIKDKDRDGLHF